MATITQINQLDLINGDYTYADYLLWKLEERVELLKGKIFKMSPAPNTYHQRISGKLYLEIGNFLKGKRCEAFSAPFDVRLPRKDEKGDEIHTVVQPDLCVICDENKLDERGCVGAPDLVIEILSPGNSKKEMKNKFEIYQESGVCEYWIVNPEHENILVYVLENEKYKSISQTPIVDDYITSVKFPNLKIHTNNIFK
ncbi:Uma2 family endonuclease [Capnocytophaga canimorsus]|uniref:Uma2 family endonuclease n=1 Tax=Capnocytophaga canimorsus TaxID=28188 RepID=UPI001EDFC2CA|nr:Uma2 family endonuclease [Capnocytophaga canimorsus]